MISVYRLASEAPVLVLADLHRDDYLRRGLDVFMSNGLGSLRGNHDPDWVCALRWASVSDICEVNDGGQRLVLCHYPMLTWPNARRGALQVFGHVHEGWRGSRNSVNVGVDVWNFEPATACQIAVRAATLPVNPLWNVVERGITLD